MTEAGAFRLTPLHRMWRLLPSHQRRRLATAAAALVAPHIDRGPPPAREGIAVAGELSRASGLGESARLMLLALQHLGVPHWPVDVGPLLPGADSDLPVSPGADRPLACRWCCTSTRRCCRWSCCGCRRGLAQGRRVIGYWNWELPVAPPDWRAGGRFVHEVWAPSPFTAAALAPLLAGRVRVVPLPLAVAPPRPAALDRAAFGLPDGRGGGAGVVQPRLLLRAQEPAGGDRRVPCRVRRPAGPAAAAEDRQPRAFPGRFRPHRRGHRRRRPTSGWRRARCRPRTCMP